MLSDGTIRKLVESGEIVISPFRDMQLQPASYDVRLAGRFMHFNPEDKAPINPKVDNSQRMIVVEKAIGQFFKLLPGQFVLAATIETIGVSAGYSCFLGGKSSLARNGVSVHETAGFIDPGNSLVITLELYNSLHVPVILWVGDPIAQVVFYKLDKPCERPYGTPGLGSKYLGATTVEASKLHLNSVNGGNDETR